jgi:hypothetical protein
MIARNNTGVNIFVQIIIFTGRLDVGLFSCHALKVVQSIAAERGCSSEPMGPGDFNPKRWTAA